MDMTRSFPPQYTMRRGKTRLPRGNNAGAMEIVLMFL
jgi:hypothetical protein